MSINHTPGPWLIVGCDAAPPSVSDSSVTSSQKAKARVREAADELLVALENYMSAFGQALEAHGIPFNDQQRAADSRARAALAKAKGEPQ